ncbi:hypothetical protein QEJ31_03705 [Pigmentibacter sp. JX0631]|uniref:hypothetical protein n=1 Tax=Pigmentibacter sp. JX0631 TaxID=2976982 RepID=UPI0024696BCB|nr:hypothetical protein [Pigmentibacter sp. JX0631]WGL60708.1 hypothetical protein QEJ31_03705 [Pigmentibacter sp. JX0631]
MKEAEWQTLESNNFIIYFPKEAKDIASYSIQSLEKSYPYLSFLMGTKLDNNSLINLNRNKDNTLFSKFSKIPFIIGNQYDGAGFANPVTLNIEAQILHNRTSSFFQHELVHRLMYEHNDLSVGPIGRLFSLAMMPTWWIEGLAEYLTNSVGEHNAINVLKTMALQQHWPSWERLHSLYKADDDTNLRGYVISGYFLGYIFSKVKNKDLYQIHQEISHQTVIPPFYNAVDSWLKENLGKTAEELYVDFKGEQEKYWKNKTTNLPNFVSQENLKNKIGQKYIFPLINIDNKTYFSKLTSNKSPYSSALFSQEHDGKEKRIPVNFFGSSIFATNNSNPLELVTSTIDYYSNGKIGHNIQVVSNIENISNTSKSNYTAKTVSLSTEQSAFFIDSITAIENKKYIISGVSNGNTELKILNLEKDQIDFIEKFNFPKNIKVLYSVNNTECFYYILDSDENLTSLKKQCISNNKILPATEIIPEKKFIIKDAYVRNSNSIILKVVWNDIFAIIDFNPVNKSYSFLFAFSEWIENISPAASDPENSMTFWYYNKGEYFLLSKNLNEIKENYFHHFKKNEIVENDKNFYSEYIPPYKKIFKNNIKLFSPEDIKTISQTENEQNNHDHQLKEKEAFYDSRFLFAYPYGLPDFLGGPSIGLFSIPLMDQIERYRIILFGGYNFYLDAPSGSIAYLNNRIFDSFSISIFSNPYFNGYYDSLQNDGSKLRYYNYLQQSGISINAAWKYQFLNSIFSNQLSIYNLQPYGNLTTAPKRIGPQYANILSLSGILSFDLINTAFYLAENEQVDGEWLKYLMQPSIGATKYFGLGNGEDSSKTNTGNLDYYNVNASLINKFSFFKTALSLSGKISTTQGSNNLNNKEIYSPYQSYILGSTTSLNFISYPIIGNGSLFELQAGNWSYAGTIAYDFPLYPSFEKKFLFSYLNNWRGITSLTRGGVSSNEKISNFTGLTSASIGSSVDVDIKGFQLFPSIYYSWIVGSEENWYVLFQLKFMDFL